MQFTRAIEIVPVITVAGFAARVCLTEPAFSGRLKIAQRFIAGIVEAEPKSVKRTAEHIRRSAGYYSAVRFTDFKSIRTVSQQ
jgi:hypothetical protein